MNTILSNSFLRTLNIDFANDKLRTAADKERESFLNSSNYYIRYGFLWRKKRRFTYAEFKCYVYRGINVLFYPHTVIYDKFLNLRDKLILAIKAGADIQCSEDEMRLIMEIFPEKFN